MWHSCTNNFIYFGGINKRYLFAEVDDELKCRINLQLKHLPFRVVVMLYDYQNIWVFAHIRVI